jgi:hypothetical protein
VVDSDDEVFDKEESSPKRVKPAEPKTSIASFFLPRKPKAEAKPVTPRTVPASSPEKQLDPESTPAGPISGDIVSIRPGAYHPVEAAGWAVDEPVPYRRLCDTLLKIEGVASRLEMQAVSAFGS